VLTARLLHQPDAVWRELPRRLAVGLLLAPFGLIPCHSTRLLGARWRLAYTKGFIRAAFGWRPTAAAIEHAEVPVAA
jgi:glucosyl-dolichyl phosphate glucuronosyltransferase